MNKYECEPNGDTKGYQRQRRPTPAERGSIQAVLKAVAAAIRAIPESEQALDEREALPNAGH